MSKASNKIGDRSLFMIASMITVGNTIWLSCCQLGLRRSHYDVFPLRKTDRF
ncbi:MAG: hypothetical protein ACKO5Q_03215 [Microcystaceae cyanobacterium]